ARQRLADRAGDQRAGVGRQGREVPPRRRGVAPVGARPTGLGEQQGGVARDGAPPGQQEDGGDHDRPHQDPAGPRRGGDGGGEHEAGHRERGRRGDGDGEEQAGGGRGGDRAAGPAGRGAGGPPPGADRARQREGERRQDDVRERGAEPAGGDGEQQRRGGRPGQRGPAAQGA